MDFQPFLKSRISTVGLSVLLLLTMVMTAKLLVQKREVDREIYKLKMETEKIAKDNQEFTNLIKYFNTPEYQDRQAREKLNLQKKGEYVVVLPKDDSNSGESGSNQTNNVSNPKKWFNYFFSDSFSSEVK